MEKTFEIYFSDLNEEAQKELIKRWDVKIDETNWDIFPLTVIVKESEEE